ncbi:MAG TPA: tyrosine-type recombinase/integrase [Nitrospira sp.]|nr:tyrosine-type recombinase/integrase [Nitrospira sp.]
MARYIDSPYLYPGRDKQKPRDADTWYRKRFKPALVAAGIQTDQTDNLWHAWRHTFGSRLASLQYKEAAIMQAGGWTTSKAVQRYIALYDESLKEAAERLSTIKPTGIGNGTVTKTGIDTPAAVDTDVKLLKNKTGLA